MRWTPFIIHSDGKKVTTSSHSLDKNECLKLLKSLEWLPKRHPNLCIEIETFRLMKEAGIYHKFSACKELRKYMEELREITRTPFGRGRHAHLVKFIGYRV